MNSKNRIAINTVILYARMLITVGISLYSTRLILNALGATDFGIYNLVGGVITMLAFLNASMTTATQRYLSFHQGKNDLSKQRAIFNNSLLLHLIIGVIILFILEIVGLFLFNNFLSIPVTRISAAKVIYHFIALTVFATVLSSPFTGSLNAHENMLWIAVVNIVEVLLRLFVAILLYNIKGDSLIFYAWATAAISVVSLVLYATFCFKKYKECALRFKDMSKSLMKELSSFAGWNLFGAACTVGRVEGLAVVLNLFFGTVVNAAEGIANQVTGQITFFSATLLRAIDPQIIKSEGAEDRQRMLRLSMMASKYGFFLLAFIAIPCIFEMPQILLFWLKNVPDYTVVFCRLMLIGIMTNQLTAGLQSGLQAVGKIKMYQAVVGILQLTNLPIAYILLKINLPAYSVFLSVIGIELISCYLRLIFLKRVAGLSINEYLNRVLAKEFIPLIVAILSCLFITTFISVPYRFLITLSSSAILFMLAVYFYGMENVERNYISDVYGNLINKIRVAKLFKPV